MNRRSGRRLRSLTPLIVLAFFAGLISSTPTPTVALAAGDVSPDTDIVWDVGDATSDVAFTGQLRALVWDIEEFNGAVYVAGKFLNVYAPNGDQFRQPYLAAFDLESGQLISAFQPKMRGPVYAIDISPDGTIIAGGEIPGGLQAVHPVTGADVSSFKTNLSYTSAPAVFDLEVIGEHVYLGGRFTSAGAVPLENLARVFTATGAVDPTWTPKTGLDAGTPQLGGINVFGLAVDAARDRVYVAGKFGSINGNKAAAYFATLHMSSPALRTDVPQGMPAGVLSHRQSFSMWQYDVQFHADRVYLGGQAHQTVILDAATLSPLRVFATNTGVGDEFAGGDTQVLHVGRTTIWAGCHCWASLAEYPIGSRNRRGQQTYAEYLAFVKELRTVPGSLSQQKVSAGYGIDIATGNKKQIDFNVNGQAGAWALLEDSNGRLWMGGQFTSDNVRNRVVRGLTRFSPPGLPEQVPQPEFTSGAAPTDFGSMFQSRNRLVFSWQEVPDATGYEVLQNGSVVGSPTDPWWFHVGLRAGTSWSYAVRAVLTDGTKTPPSSSISISTAP